MDLNNRKHLHAVARDRISNAPEAPKIALLYGATVVVSSLLINGSSFFLGDQISKAGGLHNLGLRSMLSTLQNMLPLVINFLLMCVELGFLGAMLRVSRRQYASPNSMRIGFDRFWVLLRATILQGALYALVGMASFYLSLQLFLITPLSRGMLDLLLPMMEKAPSLDPTLLLADPALAAQLSRSMLPMLILMMVILAALILPLYYHLRLVNFILLDKPGIGALAAMRESRILMRKKCLQFFKLDLSMWWYFLALLVAGAVGYGDLLLAMLGVSLPETVGYFLFLGLNLVLSFGIMVFLRPHVDVAYGLAYDSLRPREPEGGVVLGNIFNM